MPEDLLIDLVSAEWVDERLIVPKWIEAAQTRAIKRNGRPHLDIDVARSGDDETVILPREGGRMRGYRVHSKADTMTTTGTW